MKAGRMANNITHLSYLLKKSDVISSGTQRIMQEASSYVRSFSPDQWELRVLPTKPIEFLQAEKDARIKADISCLIKVDNSNNNLPITDLNVLLRVWSTRRDISYRRDWDSVDINKKLKQRSSFHRVMFRCHFDKCSQGQKAPIFHLQFGGDPLDDEFYWFPHNIELPRFPSPPLDLILACELVVASFFPAKYAKLSQDGTWVSLIQESESFFVNRFYKICNNYFSCHPQHDQTLLRHISS